MNAPQQVSLLEMKSIICTCIARAEKFLVVMKIERIEVDTLLSFDLYNAKNFAR